MILEHPPPRYLLLPLPLGRQLNDQGHDFKDKSEFTSQLHHLLVET